MEKVLILASVGSMIDQFNIENINLLKELGYEVHVAANFENGNTSSKERMNEFKKELDEKKILYHQIDFSRNILDLGSNIKAYKQIKNLLMKNNYKFIHCHSPIGGVCGRIASKLTKTKVIYTAHGFHFFKGSSIFSWIAYYPIEKLLSYITDVLITINREDYNLAKNNMKAKSVYYIPGIGIDCNKHIEKIVNKQEKRKSIGIKMDDIMILSVGELNKNKNHEIVIKALSKIGNSKIHYCIAGKGELSDDLNSLSKQLNIDKNIHILGFRKDVSELYKISDVFCFPSYREGLSVALMEAMASSLPVVCSKIRGNVDLIEANKGGYLCNTEDIDSYVFFLEKLSNNKNIRFEMGEYNKTFIKSFGIDIVKREMLKIYKEVSND